MKMMHFFQIKVIGTTLTYLIQQTNDRLALRYKRQVKRNKMKGIPSGPLAMTSSINDSNRLTHISPNNSALLSSPNIFSAVQGTHAQSMLPTATRNPSTVGMTKKKTTSSLESLLSSSSTTTPPNSINQFNNTSMDAYQFTDLSPTKQTKATKAAATKKAANKDVEPARRAPAAGTGAKR